MPLNYQLMRLTEDGLVSVVIVVRLHSLPPFLPPVQDRARLRAELRVLGAWDGRWSVPAGVMFK